MINVPVDEVLELLKHWNVNKQAPVMCADLYAKGYILCSLNSSEVSKMFVKKVAFEREANFLEATEVGWDWKEQGAVFWFGNASAQMLPLEYLREDQTAMAGALLIWMRENGFFMIRKTFEA